MSSCVVKRGPVIIVRPDFDDWGGDPGAVRIATLDVTPSTSHAASSSSHPSNTPSEIVVAASTDGGAGRLEVGYHFGKAKQPKV